MTPQGMGFVNGVMLAPANRSPRSFLDDGLAQGRATIVPNVELTAEHQQWHTEHARWAVEHVTMAKRSRAVADAIEKGDGDTDQHGSETPSHGQALAWGGDTSALASAHARLRF